MNTGTRRIRCEHMQGKERQVPRTHIRARAQPKAWVQRTTSTTRKQGGGDRALIQAPRTLRIKNARTAADLLIEFGIKQYIYVDDLS